MGLLQNFFPSKSVFYIFVRNSCIIHYPLFHCDSFVDLSAALSSLIVDTIPFLSVMIKYPSSVIIF